MKSDRSKAPRDTRFPFSFVGRLSRQWEGRLEHFLSELNSRGETRLEELARKLRQTDAWLRVLSAAEKAEKRRDAARERVSRLGAQLLGQAGIATDAQVETLVEELRRLSWRLDRMAQKLEENPTDGELPAGPEAEFRSIG